MKVHKQRRPTVVYGWLLAWLMAGWSPLAAQEMPLPELGTEGGLFGGLQPAEEPLSVEAQFTRPTPQQPARLFITVRLQPDWYVYSITQPSGGPTRTVIHLDAVEGLELLGDFQAVPQPSAKIDPVFDNLRVETHHGTVIWHAPIQLPEGIDPASFEIGGSVYAQACQATTCLPPKNYTFVARLGEGIPLPEAAAAPEAVDLRALVLYTGLGFLGGLILNLMPCVLPVISLKILSFLDQAGESRGRVFMLNLWYTVGVMAVFLLLATLAVWLGLAWGELFTLAWFKVALTALVFVMALSFLGVWELPIPGFVGSGRASQLQAKEGDSGAFFKGVFATILATPCSGPLLGPIFAYLLKQPPYVSYVLFGAIGLGMASPYLLIGVFPTLIRLLPKPGGWMEVVKQGLAFLLLGTVVYLFTTMSARLFVPTLTLLVWLWFACWWSGRTPLTAPVGRRAASWLGAAVTASLVGIFAFTVLLYESKMPWKPFSPEALARARAEGKTVMVDFTADWCPTCKLNLKWAIDTAAVRKLVEQNGVVPLLADWTDQSPMIKQTLNELGYNSIPLLAIWPAGAAESEVIILPDFIWKSQVIEALQEAGPSRDLAAR